MKKITQSFLLVTAIILFAGCAGGPKFKEVRNTLPALNPEHGRIYLYRTAVMGAAVQPDVMLNKEKIGSAVPGGFFFVDRAPGNYQISTSTEVKRTLSMGLEKGQTRFVRLNIAMGFWVGHVYPELVEPADGEKEIQDCGYVTARKPQ